MLVFFFIVLIILGSLIVLLAATTAQLQIINFEIKDNKKNDGEIKLILKFLKLIPYLEKISFLKKPCIHYVQREESISNLQNERTKEIFDVLDHVINYYKEKNIYDEYKEQLEYIYTRYLLCSSLLRMVKVNDKEIREKLIEKTWTNLNTKFPNWKKNNLLKKKNKKNFYMRTLNKFTYKIYSSIFSRM